jgi:hypothetical protein
MRPAIERNDGLGTPSSRRERDDQDLRRYPEEPILRSNSGFAITVLCRPNSSWRENRECGEDKEMADMPALMALVEQIAKEDPHGENEGEIQMIAKKDKKWRRTLPCYTHLESTKVGSDSSSSQGAQDLNDLLGLLKGAIFERSQQRNLWQLHQDR